MKSLGMGVLGLWLACAGPVLAAGGNMGGGTGSEGAPYLIEDFDDFLEFSDSAKAAVYWAAGVHTRLDCELDLDPRLPGRQTYTTAVIAPDTSTDGGFQGTKYSGIFDGNDHAINHLTINTGGVSNHYLGLYGFISGATACVKNLGMENVSITGEVSGGIGGLCGYNYRGGITHCYTAGSIAGGSTLGGLCGYNEYGSIADCYATCEVAGGSRLGGLCGYNEYGSIADCYATGAVASGGNGRGIGGLCGWNDRGAITDCFAAGTVTCGNNSQRVAGLCGLNLDGTISQCYAIGDVICGDSSSGLGGLCGGNFENYGVITDCYATGSVTGGENCYDLGGLCGSNWDRSRLGGTIVTHSYATGAVAGGNGSQDLGGLCGSNAGVMTYCFATGAVHGGENSECLGGLSGLNGEGTFMYYSIIMNCYAGGSVSGESGACCLGGLCGRNDYYGIITNSYAVGEVAGGAGSGYLGGFCGDNYLDTITNSFWDVETSGIADPEAGNPDTDGMIGKTTVEMQTETTFTDAGWDFVDDDDPADWKMQCEPGYPTLFWEMYPGDINQDCDTNLEDFAIMASQWLDAPGEPSADISPDGGDGVVDIEDFFLLSILWLSDQPVYIPDPSSESGWETYDHWELNTASLIAQGPHLSADKRILYYGRRNSDSSYQEIAMATRDSDEGPFTLDCVLTELGDKVANPWISADGQRMYYNENLPVDGVRWLRMAQWNVGTGQWEPTMTFTEIHVSGYIDASPSLTADELTIFFGSNRPGGIGDRDIWMASRASIEEPFSNPVNVSELNSSRYEAHPSVSPDGLTIYFGADDGGSGWNANIYQATRASTSDPFSNITPVDGLSEYGINEDTPYVSEDQETILYNIDYVVLRERYWTEAAAE